MTAFLVTVLVASLAGSLHCAGMCGGLVAWCTALDGQASEGTGRRRRCLQTGAYHAGRLVTYTLLGGLAGGFGAVVDLGASQVGLSRAAAVVAGGLMIVTGVVALCRGCVVRPGAAKLPDRMQRLFKRGFDAAFDRGPVARAGIVGLLTGLLPCGWLYAFLLAAAGTGSTLAGAATMAAFWAGSVPALLAVGVGAAALTTGVRRFAPTVTAVALLLIGVFTVIGRVSLPAYATGPVASLDPVESVESVKDAKPLCCDEHD